MSVGVKRSSFHSSTKSRTFARPRVTRSGHVTMSLSSLLLIWLSTLFLFSYAYPSHLSTLKLAGSLHKRTVPPYFPPQPPSCPICERSWPSIDSCAEACPVLANFSMVCYTFNFMDCGWLFTLFPNLRSYLIPENSSTSSSVPVPAPSKRPSPNALTGSFNHNIH
jgi:hypothetical protein